MEKYCEIKKNNYKSNTKYLLSASLFLLSNSYKGPNRYINGLKKLYEFVEKNKEFTLRIYYDDSVYQDSYYKFIINKFLKDKERIELVKFKCNKFLIDKNIHKGTFGTLLRFLPLFEKSDFKIIYIVDIDDTYYDYIKIYFEKFEKDLDQKILIEYINFYFLCFDDYAERYCFQFDNKFGNVALANFFIKDYRFDIKIFTDFLEYILSSDELFKKIKKINEQFYKSNIRSDIIETYGIDEYFLNKILINKLNKSQIYFIKESYYISYFLENLIIYDSKPSNLIKKYLIEIIKQYYPEIDKHYCINELKNILLESTDINSEKKYSKLFFSNYFKTVDFFKKITLKYYNNYFYIFNEAYIDDLIYNNFKDVSWYLKKNWNILPDNIKNNINL